MTTLKVSTASQKVLATNGSVDAIRKLGFSNDELLVVAKEIRALPGYHGKIIVAMELATTIRAQALELGKAAADRLNAECEAYQREVPHFRFKPKSAEFFVPRGLR